MPTSYSVRFKQWRFWAVVGWVLLDLFTPFFPLTAALLALYLLWERFEFWADDFLAAAFSGPYDGGYKE